jgi:uncharacterized alpha-E superfamily protein
MLSRTADSLYWLGRYVERAENTARILDVSYRSSLLPAPGKRPASDWEAALALLGDPKIFAERYGRPKEASLVTYMALDRDNPSSIAASLRAARENARTVRATITTEMWESLNATWLELSELDEAGLLARGAREFFDWVKERAHLFRGVMLGTMVHDDALRFVQLGGYLERADNTARLFSAKYRLLGGGEGGAVDYYQWGGLLRAVSAFRAYHQSYSDVITPGRVAELLVLKPEMPRSLRFCFDRINELVEALAAGRPLECRRSAGEAQARLRFARIEEIASRGTSEFLAEAIRQVALVSDHVARDFMMVP